MHDTFLFSRLADSLSFLCKENKIKRIDKLVIIVHKNSHINEKNMYDYLNKHTNLINDNTKIIIKREEIEELTAVIESVEGN
ncbi:MAG: hypothetical protein FH751_14580 [Firmicutes bacterium]|nr:hypothetical protein [Bacillota bacterium]